MSEFNGGDRRKPCEGCVKDIVNEMKGENNVNKWLIRAAVLFILGGGVWQTSVIKAATDKFSDQAVQVARNTDTGQRNAEAITRLTEFVEETERERKRNVETQTKIILEAIGKIK